MILFWHKYKYFPYEKNLAIREVESFFPGIPYLISKDGVEISLPENDPDTQYKLSRLVYFSAFGDAQKQTQTLQRRLEYSDQGPKRQVTRYSSHGLHEYKGKFNPQIVHALLNIFQIQPGQRVLDPFCGSGTTLLECTHHNIASAGTDINPLAVFIANTKQQAIETSAAAYRDAIETIEHDFQNAHQVSIDTNSARIIYLQQWFSPQILSDLETLQYVLKKWTLKIKNFFFAVASNLLREYSFQDPDDLRIRRRKTPLPTIPFFDQFKEKAIEYIDSIEKTKKVLGEKKSIGTAYCTDIKSVQYFSDELFDFAVTSPPYATALPYIDTQRLSLVWLGMIPPDQIMPLDMSLIGSREIKKKQLQEGQIVFAGNLRKVPALQYDLCQNLKTSLSSTDGFRRQAVPYLLYRYFADMQNMFIRVRKLVKHDAVYAMVVGCNHTTLGGKRINIDTPLHLAQIAQQCKWELQEIINLQTYQRYGYNIKNATTAESLIILRAK